jgi:hypothetical protein
VDILFKRLLSYSLVKRQTSSSTFSIYPVVQIWARERLDEVRKAGLAKKALEILAKSVIPSTIPKMASEWIQEHKVVPHIRAFLSHGLDALPFYEDQIMPIYQETLAILLHKMKIGHPPLSVCLNDTIAGSTPCIRQVDLHWLFSMAITLNDQGDPAISEWVF